MDTLLRESEGNVAAKLIVSAISVALLLGLQMATSANVAFAVVIGLSVGHSALSMIYAKGGLKEVGEAGLARWAFWLMVPLAFLLTGMESRLLLLLAAFGVHHALAETYFGPGRYKAGNFAKRSLEFIAILGTYFVALHGDFSLTESWMLGLLGASGLAWAVRMALEPIRDWGRLWLVSPWMLIGPVLAGLSLVVEVGFTALVGHHLMLFMLMPLFFPPLQKRSEGRRRFWLQSAWVHGLGLTLSLGALGWSVWRDDFFVWNLAILYFIWSTWVHVLWSFFIAGANPSWIRRLARS
jgi:hypothetical protein